MPRPHAPRPLTPRQQRFVDSYLVSRNAAQAAGDAGYSPAGARMTGSELLKKPPIADALRARGLEPPCGVHPQTQSRQPRARRPRSGLSLRAERFALAYLVCGNAAEAARRLGIRVEHAGAVGSRMLHRPDIAAFIAAERAASAERTRIDADRVKREYARIAFAEIGDIARWDEDGIVLKPSDAIAADDRAAIAELRLRHGKNGIKATIRLHSKQAALDSLAKLMGLYAKKPEPPADPRAAWDAKQKLREKLQRIMRGGETAEEEKKDQEENAAPR
ncbi:MAG TPA: terminase small subunit [Stellaceae bacterium]|jgi:phage terminase small subunit